MAKSRSEIIGDIEDYVERNGGDFTGWFVGATGAPKQVLFTRHKVKEKGDAWIARSAKDEYEAHEVAEYFRANRRTKGAPADPKPTDLYVYAYKQKSHTKP